MSCRQGEEADLPPRNPHLAHGFGFGALAKGCTIGPLKGSAGWGGCGGEAIVGTFLGVGGESTRWAGGEERQRKPFSI